MKVLKDKADRRVAVIDLLLELEFVDMSAVFDDLARGYRVQSAEEGQERRLAATALTDNKNKALVGQSKTYVIEGCAISAFAAFVYLRQFFYFYHALCSPDALWHICFVENVLFPLKAKICSLVRHIKAV